MDAAHSIGALGSPAIPRRAETPSRRRLAIYGLLLCCALSAGASPAHAGSPIFAFTDDQGVTHYTNVPRGDSRYERVVFRDQVSPWRAAPSHKRYDELIGETAAFYRLPPALVKAVIAAESAFDPLAVSRRGAQGLMQLMPQTAAQLGVEDPLEPASNVKGGSGYLRAMLDRYGDLSRALAAYNAGPTAVDRYGGVPPYRETRDYVDRVLTYYRAYHVDFAR
jgi:soluble lytic murein transglycosylase-like protein